MCLSSEVQQQHAAFHQPQNDQRDGKVHYCVSVAERFLSFENICSAFTSHMISSNWLQKVCCTTKFPILV